MPPDDYVIFDRSEHDLLSVLECTTTVQTMRSSYLFQFLRRGILVIDIPNVLLYHLSNILYRMLLGKGWIYRVWITLGYS